LVLSLATDANADAGTDLFVREGLAIRTDGGRREGRSAFHIDPLEALIVTGKWSPPRAGDSLTMPDGTTRAWEVVTARTNGSFTNTALRGGYVYLPFVSDIDQVLLLKAAGHSMVYVNGEPRAGDPYQNGSVALPVALHRGTNDLLFAVARGALRVLLAEPAHPLMLDLRDVTAPDLIAGEKNDTQAAVLVVNSTTNYVHDLLLTASTKDGKQTETRLPRLLPLSTRKVGFPIKHSGKSNTNRVEFTLKLFRKQGLHSESCDSTKLSLRLRRPDETHTETFVSDIDGSVQYYAVVPAQPLTRNHAPLALVLTTHGASVEGRGQAEAYSSKTWAHIVAPTNRRPYGFDWEDWGRHDALEVLAIAQQKFHIDPKQVYLTGHSMGGHGAWHLGVTFPDHFAAIAPSAGWISFFSYAGGQRYEGTNELQKLIQRSATPGDTLALASNYLHHGVYILHGDADDNVPVGQARTMRGVLEKFHRDFTYHEQPGAGHWWGNACVDWPPIFDFFARHKIPDDQSILAIHFTTANPGVSASSHWVSIEAQQHDLAPSTVDINWDPNGRRFTGNTENVARLGLSLAYTKPGRPLTVSLDGQALTDLAVKVDDKKLWFDHVANVWTQTGPRALSLKGPHRYGPFKEAFNHRMLFVFGTHGTPQENTWAFAKARFDAESFWYRGNGSIDVLPDTDFDANRERDRGVILYGNADSNGAWKSLLGESPVQVNRDRLRIGSRELPGTDLACLFLRPRPGSDVALVGVISGTGVVGMKLTDRVPYFLAGVAFPDCTVFGPDALKVGGAAARVAGFFGKDWSVQSGELLWRDKGGHDTP